MRPIIAVTMGDPAGVGPEICVEAFRNPEIYEKMKPVLIANTKELRKALVLKQCDFEINVIENPSEGKYILGIIDLIEVDVDGPQEIIYGSMPAYASRLAHAWIMKAIDLGCAGDVQVVTTAPINKEAFKNAGFQETSHTDILKKALPGSKSVSMFSCVNLRVFHLTRHMSLLSAIQSLNIDDCVTKLTDIDKTLKSLGIENPKIALAALNPHASDNGMFGTEEAEILSPAVKICNERGMNIVGPIPADVVFHHGLGGDFDGILSLYHDQGHIACKTYDFERSVSATLGLPFMRSTVDHGTAYDIAGKGLASSGNLIESMLVGVEYWLMGKKTKEKCNG